MKIDIYLQDNEIRKQRAEAYVLAQKQIEKIKRIALKIVRYPDLREAYDYVDGLFPNAHVKDVAIYKVAAADLEKMGYGGVEGFYDKISKIVVLCGARKYIRSRIERKYRVEAKVTSDEVLVHELCHYSYVAEGRRSVSRDMNEEFAYGWSMGYLRKKGYSDEYIIEYNFLPYLLGMCYDEATRNILVWNDISTAEFNSFSKFKKKEFNRKYGRKIFLRAKELGIEQGKKLVALYSNKLEKGGYVELEEGSDRFSMLDL